MKFAAWHLSFQWICRRWRLTDRLRATLLGTIKARSHSLWCACEAGRWLTVHRTGADQFALASSVHSACLATPDLNNAASRRLSRSIHCGRSRSMDSASAQSPHGSHRVSFTEAAGEQTSTLGLRNRTPCKQQHFAQLLANHRRLFTRLAPTLRSSDGAEWLNRRMARTMMVSPRRARNPITNACAEHQQRHA